MVLSLHHQFSVYPERVLSNDYKQQRNDNQRHEFESQAEVAGREHFQQFVSDQQQTNQSKELPVQNGTRRLGNSVFDRRPEVDVRIRNGLTGEHTIECQQLLQLTLTANASG